MATHENCSNLRSLHCVGMLSNLNDLRKHRNLCDVSLCVGGCQLSAHKVVLSASSPYFKAMFTQDMAEKNQSIVTFQCVSVEAMETIIDFAYTGKLEVTANNVQNIIPAATLFQMSLITEECCRFLESQLNAHNCIGIWRFADTYGLFRLAKNVWKYINQNFEEVSKLDEILELPIKYLARILVSDDLNVTSEGSVFELVETWILADFQSRKVHFPNLLQCVRVPLLSSMYLKTQSRLNKLFCSSLFVQNVYNSLQSKNLMHNVKQRCAPKILCAAGGKKGLFATLGSLEVYTPQTNNWQTMTPLPHNRFDCGAVVCDRKLYILGGVQCSQYKQYTNSTIVWDPESNVWAHSVSMIKCRSSFGAVAVKGDIYALGGYDGESYLKSMEKFCQRKQTWESLPDMMQTRTCFSATSLGDYIYAVGGYGPAHQDSVEAFDVSSRIWHAVTPMLNKRINFGIAILHGRIYVVGGHSGTSHLRSIERYNPTSKEWEICSTMPRPRTGVGTAVIDGKLYVVGGHSGQEYLDDVDCYDPTTDTWVKCAEMASPRCGFGLAAM